MTYCSQHSQLVCQRQIQWHIVLNIANLSVQDRYNDPLFSTFPTCMSKTDTMTNCSQYSQLVCPRQIQWPNVLNIPNLSVQDRYNDPLFSIFKPCMFKTARVMASVYTMCLSKTDRYNTSLFWTVPLSVIDIYNDPLFGTVQLSVYYPSYVSVCSHVVFWLVIRSCNWLFLFSSKTHSKYFGVQIQWLI